MARDVAQAIRELEVELGLRKQAFGRRASQTPGGTPPLRVLPEGWIDWTLLYEWSKANPGIALEIEDVHRQGIVRFRARYPELTVTSHGYHLRPGTNTRVGTLWVCYNPKEGEEG